MTRRAVGGGIALVLLLGIAFLLYAVLRSRPQDLPWTALDLGQPVGLFTGRKLAALTQDAPRCRALLRRAGIAFSPLPPNPPDAAGQCGYDDAVVLERGGARGIELLPPREGMSCPVAAALALWEWHVVQPAARRRLGVAVARIEHLGSYNCRRMYGRGTGDWSEHATADAIDVAGFRLTDGSQVRVLEDWTGEGPKARFLREVRDGACGLFATTLSPDYNAAHRDHFHLDQAERGRAGWRACR